MDYTCSHFQRLVLVYGVCTGVTLAMTQECCLVGVSWKADYQSGPLTRDVKLWVAQAPGMPGTFSLPQRLSDPELHHGTCVTHVP